MAIKATVYKLQAELADMDRDRYGDYSLTVAAHPSETGERLMLRILAFVLNVPVNNDLGDLEFGRDICDTDGPCLCQSDLTGQIQHWIEVGQPDDRRLMKASGRARLVTVYAYGTSTAIWWADTKNKITRARNIAVWQIPAEQSRELAELAQRSMRLQVTVQDATIWVGDGTRSVEITPSELLKRTLQ
jgi:uncharacterized protein YaeQ